MYHEPTGKQQRQVLLSFVADNSQDLRLSPPAAGVAGESRSRVMGPPRTSRNTLLGRTGRHAPLVPCVLPHLAVVLAGLGWASAAAADPLPARLSAEVGPRSSRTEVAVDAAEGDTRIRVGTGRHTHEVTVRGVTADATLESVVTSGGRVAVLRATGEAEVAAVIGLEGTHPVVLWSGRLDLHGDPGERWADAIEIADRTGDGVTELVVGVRRESLALCGSEPALTGTRALHEGALVGVELRPAFPAGPSAELTASATSPGPSSAPCVPALRFTAASSDASSSDALTAGAPSGLTDGSAATGWSEGRAGGGMGELVSGRWAAPVPIRALALRGGPGFALPSRVVLVGDGGARVVVTIPAEAAEVAWVVPPEPLGWSCISLVVEEPRAGATMATGFAEIEAYTDYDFGRGLEALVDELVADGEIGERATLWLSRAGEPALVLLEAAWERLGVLGRRRAVRVAAASPLREGSRAPALLGAAAGDDDADVRSDALVAMRRMHALDLLAAAASAPGVAGEAAANVLAELPYEASIAVAPLLSALEAEGGAARPELRRAIARAARGDEAARVSSWAAAADAPALASAALGLAGRDDEEGRGLARALTLAASGAAREFPELYRLTRAAVLLGDAGSPELDAWLGRAATEAETWMVRAGAIEALGARADALTMAAALADEYPRVRVAAVGARDRQPESAAVLSRMAHADRWPIVRLAALDAIATEPEGGPAARTALDDRVAGVRAHALEILVARGDREAWPAVTERLLDEDEWPEVYGAALRFVEAFCVAEASDALVAVVERGAADGAWAPDVDAAVDALDVALRIGGEAAERARRIALRGGAATEALAAVLERASGRPACTP